MDTTIRTATSDDLEFIVNSQTAMALETEGLNLEAVIVQNAVEKVFKNPSLGQYYVALVNDIPSACLLTTYEWSDWRCKTVVWIQSVFVKPDCRGLGVYKSMYHHIQEIVQADNSFAGIRLYVDKTNTKAIDVYQKLGMTKEHYHLYEWMID